MPHQPAEEDMTTHVTGTREQWLGARLELLEAEKDLTRRSDELARRRRELPWVPVDKEYRFEIDEGSATTNTNAEPSRGCGGATGATIMPPPPVYPRRGDGSAGPAGLSSGRGREPGARPSSAAGGGRIATLEETDA
jgi:hypothetical protein